MILKANIPEAGYGKKVVLKNVSIEVGDNQIIALIGPNGAGKSTLLKAIIGILPLASGSVQFNGVEISKNRPEQNVGGGISFVPQGNRVFTELTVMENLEIGGYLLKNREAVTSQISHVVSLFPDLSDRLKQNAGKLSGGEKQQLALARALMLQPKLLMLDEPSLGLSPKLVSKAFETIKEVKNKTKIAVLVVEQKVHEILRIADRVYALRMGEVAFHGTPSELQKGDTMKKIFLV